MPSAAFASLLGSAGIIVIGSVELKSRMEDDRFVLLRCATYFLGLERTLQMNPGHPVGNHIGSIYETGEVLARTSSITSVPRARAPRTQPARSFQNSQREYRW